MTEAIIQVDGLVKRYRQARTNAVDGITFHVRAGEFFALLGPNGAGKTTTISILTTTLSPTSGRVSIAGHDVVAEAAEVRQDVGIIFQRPSLDRNLTGEENVRLHSILYGEQPWRPTFRLMPGRYRAQVRELAELLGLGRAIFQPVKRMSGGMMRKLEIMRSLLHRPRVLFLDEPTAGLDPISRRNLWEYLTQVRRSGDTTVFLTTHQLEEAEEADTICILDRGQIRVQGPPSHIKSDLVQPMVRISPEPGREDPLRKELEELGVEFDHDPDGTWLVRLGGRTVHQLLRSIRTPLAVVRTVDPSLEDAYVEIVGRSSILED